MSQQDESPGELLVASVALERLLSRVVSHMIVENVTTVKSFRTMGTLELLLLVQVCSKAEEIPFFLSEFSRGLGMEVKVNDMVVDTVSKRLSVVEGDHVQLK